MRKGTSLVLGLLLLMILAANAVFFLSQR